MRFRPEFRKSVGDIFHELSNPFTKGKINPKSAVSADLVTLGDYWLDFAIGKGLIEPVKGAEDQDWFQDLSDTWKVKIQSTSCFHHFTYVGQRAVVFIGCFIKYCIVPRLCERGICKPILTYLLKVIIHSHCVMDDQNCSLLK